MGMKPRPAVDVVPDSIFTDPWEQLENALFDNEATVENRLVLPLLRELGHPGQHVQPQYEMWRAVGSKKYRMKADFAIFAKSPHGTSTSLLVVEAKSPSAGLKNSQVQAESYAQVLRAPFYLATDGIDLEVWQLKRTDRSELVLSVKVNEITAKRGELERLLRPEPMVNYANSIEAKDIESESIDVSDYLVSVQASFVLPDHIYLSRRLEGEHGTLLDSDLLSTFERGCTIEGPSGSGKSHLLLQIATQVIEERNSSQQRVPVYVDLADAAAAGQAIAEYVHKGMRQHVPSLAGSSAFQSFWNRDQIVLLCDSWDLVSTNSRGSTAAELRSIVRTTKIQLVVVSATGLTDLQTVLPSLGLEPLQYSERVKLAKKHGLDEEALRQVVTNLPRSIRRQLNSPLLLDIVLRQSAAHSCASDSIAEIFKSWIESLLRRDSPPPGKLSTRKLLLRELSQIGMRINIEDAHDCATRLGALDDYQELSRLGIIVETTFQMRFAHDSVGQFLRAHQAIEKNDGGDSALAELRIASKDSLVALFMASMVGDLAIMCALWKRLANVDLRSYLDALHVRLDLSASADEMSDSEFQGWFLEELLQGHDDLVRTWFSPAAHLFSPYRETPGAKLNEMKAAIRGHVSKVPPISFQFVDSTTQANRINSDTPFTNRFETHIAPLSRTNDRLDGPRLVAAREVRRELLCGIDNLQLYGGKYWARERLLCDFYCSRSDLDLTTDQVRQLLYDDDHFDIEIRKAIDDALVSGSTTIRELGLPGGDLPIKYGTNWSTSYSDDALEKLVEEQERRIMACYREIVETNFGEVSRLLQHYPMWPIRTQITLSRVNKRGRDSTWASYWWEPVAMWRQATIEVSWSDSLPKRNWDDLNLQAEVLREKLEHLNRPSHKLIIGQTSRLRLMQSPKETLIAHTVKTMLTEDVAFLFDKI